MKDITSIADLTPDQNNANKGTKRGVDLLEQSLQSYGAGRSVLVDKNGVIIAGNKTIEGAVGIGLDDVEVVRTDGKRVVVVQRTDLDLGEGGAARQLAYADNRASEVGLAWDEERIAADLEGGVDLSNMWFKGELEALVGDLGDSMGAGDAEGKQSGKAQTTCPSCGHVF